MTTFSLVRGRAMRATKVSACGEPVLGPDSVVTTDGFVSAAFSPNTETGETITVTNANGKRCVNDEPDAQFINYGVTISFCGVNPELITMMTGQPVVLDDTGEPVGFRVNSKIALIGAFALEVWTGVAGQACGEAGESIYGYSLAPFIKGGTLGDFTFQNGSVDFTLQNATTRDGTGWGVGPYDVVMDGGVPGPLLEALDPYDHLHMQVTTVAPPSVADDSGTALGVEATSATAGSPATLTPANSYAPASIDDPELASLTASPTTAWTTGQYVVLRDGSYVHWSGTAWVAGIA